MKFSLIICTYKRSQALFNLLESVKQQILYPTEILIVDGSPDEFTQEMLQQNNFDNLIYFKVAPEERGLTKQRNYGIARVALQSEIVCFLDDDTILDPNYFQEIIKSYYLFPEASGIGGYIKNDAEWVEVGSDYKPNLFSFYFDGFKRDDGNRFVVRKIMGLDSDCPPGFMPEFSHGRGVGFLPPSNKIYLVEMLMGGVSSFKKSVFKDYEFSTYFEGYGLYEDADFSLRLSKAGKLYLNTAAQLSHFHDESGRPNQYLYGKMVVRNGWYVWRTKHPNPCFKAKVKWHLITILLTFIRFLNTITTSKRRESFTESIGRIVGWFSLLVSKP
jgi:GT2 family glycosyltransferase